MKSGEKLETMTEDKMRIMTRQFVYIDDISFVLDKDEISKV